jgi:hypothetical protein
MSMVEELLPFLLGLKPSTPIRQPPLAGVIDDLLDHYPAEGIDTIHPMGMETEYH